MSSPHIEKMLEGLSRRDEEDALALRSIGIKTLESEGSGFVSLDTPQGRFYLLRKVDVALFLFRSGIDSWHASTWLSMSRDGQLSSDVLLAPASGKPHQRHADLGVNVWNEYTMYAKPAVIEGEEVLALQKSLVSLMKMARGIAQQMPEFQQATAAKAQQAMTAELVPQPASSAKSVRSRRATR